MRSVPQKVIFFLDADKDDYYSLCLIAAQHYYKVIDVVGIVVDTGFVENIQDGLLLTKQWLNKIQVGTNLNQDNSAYPFTFNLYAGYNRPAFLEKRLFPKIWTNSFVSEMKNVYNITLPNFNYVTKEFTGQVIETGAPSADVLFSELFYYNDILSLSTGAPTTLAIALDKYPYLSQRLSSVYCMASNYLVPGNVPKKDSDDADISQPSPYLDFSGEYNAFMNPYALQRISLAVKNGVDVNIVPLDCTNYARLVPETVNELNAIAAPFLYYINTPWVVNLCNSFISLVATTLVTENSTLYLWDLCATNIALKSQVDQYYILGTPKFISSGKMDVNSCDSLNEVKIFMSLNYKELLTNSIRIIFNDIAYRV
jgi:inosine-uridine nucleoside N-ribohydrolase